MFNTAIFYDMENLIMGYGAPEQILSSLSLKEILRDIRKISRIGDIAVQRAYANWSDPRLRILRPEINELGIEPVQIFGFSQFPTKNAADIQLVIDAIDLAYLRPSIDVFVVVSGDGGFATLAKKLHEYGRAVVGCGYRKASNQILRAVCDDFVWLANPEEQMEAHPERPSPARSKPAEPTQPAPPPAADPRANRLTNKVGVLSEVTDDGIVAKTKEVLAWCVNDFKTHADLTAGGINISFILDGIKQVIPNFQPIKLGFPKFGEYLQFACSETPLCIIRRPSSETLMALREAVPHDCTQMPDLEKREIHSIATYLSILAASGNGPIYRLPTPGELSQVAEWVVCRRLVQTDLKTGLEEAAHDLSETVPIDAVKLAFYALVAAKVFLREPEGIVPAEQKLTLRDDLHSEAAVLDVLRDAARKKLEVFLPQFQEDLVDQMIPRAVVSSDPVV